MNSEENPKQCIETHPKMHSTCECHSEINTRKAGMGFLFRTTGFISSSDSMRSSLLKPIGLYRGNDTSASEKG
ncbi:hypothetical protein CEXT_235231 [Caerostris extrusa]|uniref:Ycf15 n=1 Tax=Caerostris extrusa TaxID=172846 RepID=A0AAV4Y8I7_CAEEX|nr:hypothetical protein CEXT_235231 [Caerostris extrusa]